MPTTCHCIVIYAWSEFIIETDSRYKTKGERERERVRERKKEAMEKGHSTDWSRENDDNDFGPSWFSLQRPIGLD